MPDGTNMPNIDEDRVGFNLNTQRLHCLIALNDRLAPALSNIAGEAFFRAFIVEDRATGKVKCNYRFRYVKEDSWFRLTPDAEKQALPLKEQVEFLAAAVEQVVRLGLRAFAGGLEAPKEAVDRFYPPEPDDAEKTIEYLIAEDLIQIKRVIDKDGKQTVVSTGTESVM